MLKISRKLSNSTILDIIIAIIREKINYNMSGDQSGVDICVGDYSYHTGTAVNLPVQLLQHVAERVLFSVVIIH